MLRRDFLKYTSLATAALLLPTPAKAAEVYDGPLWIFIHASGGWDPTSLCDPKGREITVNGTPMNKTFGASDIKTAANSSIRYAPLIGRDYTFETFFEKYGKELLVINGIDTQTNGHSDGTRYQFSGQLSRTYPSIAALIAGIKLPNSPLSFLTYGGYDFTDGLVPATRVSNTNLISKLAMPNVYSSTRNYHSPSTLARILEAKALRDSTISGRQGVGSVRKAFSEYITAHKGAKELNRVLNYYDQANSNPLPSQNMARNARFAMAAYKAGLTVSVNLSSGGFDTHSSHDSDVSSGSANDISGNHRNDHIGRMGTLLKSVDEIMQEAELQGIRDKIIVVIGSEFGRTPGYNGGNGKDHWPVSSMMMMGAGINGRGRVIGATSDDHKPKTLNLDTLTIDEANGSTITYAHIHKALRNLAGIERESIVTQYYPINSQEVPLFS